MITNLSTQRMLYLARVTRLPKSSRIGAAEVAAGDNVVVGKGVVKTEDMGVVEIDVERQIDGKYFQVC